MRDSKLKRFCLLFLVGAICFILVGQTGISYAGTHKELKLVMSTYIPASYKDIHPWQQGFVDYVNKHGKGIVQIDFYHSSTLLKLREAIPGLQAGTADIILHQDSAIQGTYPIFGVTELPFIYDNYDDYVMDCRIGSPLFNLINKELKKKNMFMIAAAANPFEHIWTLKPVRKPEDMKGLKLRCSGRIESLTLKALGTAPVSMPSAEVFMAMKRGTVDGLMSYPGTVGGRRLDDVVKYCTLGNFGAYMTPIFTTRDRWDSWPQDVKDVMIEAGREYNFRNALNGRIYLLETYFPRFNRKIEMIKLTEEETAAFKKATKPVYDTWLKQVDKKVGEKALAIVQNR